MGEKNSMSMSDPEAPAMMMKDKVSIKPGYNAGIATQNGIVVGYEISDNANDGVSFKAMLDEAAHNIDQKPQRVCADAGYGNTENYRHLEAEQIENYVKYPGWDKDLKGKRSPYEAESFSYDATRDCWICPQGKTLAFNRIEDRKNRRTGYVEQSREYRASESDCAVCPVKDACTKGAARSIRFNEELRRHRKKVVENLDSPMGQRMRSLRGVEVETVFGIQKWAFGFNRFHLRGKEAVGIEYGMFLTAFNLRRLHQSFCRFLKTGARPAFQLENR